MCDYTVPTYLPTNALWRPYNLFGEHFFLLMIQVQASKQVCRSVMNALENILNLNIAFPSCQKIFFLNLWQSKD